MQTIKKYLQFINESESLTLLYYCFDWDDNLLSMPTKINMNKLVNGVWIPTPVSTEHFAEIRNDKENWRLGENAFIEFSDDGPRGEDAFLQDMKSCIGGAKYPQLPVRKSPSWEKFIHCLTEGSLFAIITARGHKPETIRRGVEWIIDNYLDEKQKQEMYYNCLKFDYLFGRQNEFERLPELSSISTHPLISSWLSHCGYYGVSYRGFVEKHKSGGAQSPEKGKEIAIKEFVSKCANFANQIGASFKAGMSDDDMKNVMHMKSVLSELREMYPKGEFTLIDTSKGGYQKTDIKESKKFNKNSITETSHQTPGLESSVLKFTQFGNMAAQLNPTGPDQRQDDYANQLKRQTKYLTKTSKEILPNKKKKKSSK